MSFIGDYFTAMQVWRGLTKPQRKALMFPWGEHHPTVIANLTKRGLWQRDAERNGPTHTGLAVALCAFIGKKAA